jgi:acetyl-CoA carboxylase alpha subunit
MNPNFLDFEQPIADLQAKIEELRLVGNDNSLNIGDEISRLQDKSSTLTEDIFGKLTSWQIARLAVTRVVRTPWTTSSTSSPSSTSCTATVTSPTTPPSGGIARLETSR